MVQFRKITWENFDECLQLQVTNQQDNFIASNVYSLAQSYVALLNDKLPAMTFAIYDGELMVGFIMMYHDTPEENEFGDEECYGILRLMIDRRHQRKGYGTKALAKALEYIQSFPQGPAAAIYLSYDTDNMVAKRLYASFGFVETGIISDGEVVAKLEL